MTNCDYAVEGRLRFRKNFTFSFVAMVVTVISRTRAVSCRDSNLLQLMYPCVCFLSSVEFWTQCLFSTHRKSACLQVSMVMSHTDVNGADEVSWNKVPTTAVR